MQVNFESRYLISVESKISCAKYFLNISVIRDENFLVRIVRPLSQRSDHISLKTSVSMRGNNTPGCIPNIVSERLIAAPSFNRSPVAPVLSARSEPARSTRFILACSRSSSLGSIEQGADLLLRMFPWALCVQFQLSLIVRISCILSLRRCLRVCDGHYCMCPRRRGIHVCGCYGPVLGCCRAIVDRLNNANMPQNLFQCVHRSLGS